MRQSCASGPCAVAVGGGQGSACRLRFLGVGATTLADALPLPVQAAYLQVNVTRALAAEVTPW